MRRNGGLILIGLLLAIILVGLVLSETTSENGGVGQPVSFTVISEGSDSGTITERKNYRLHSTEEFSALWLMVYGTSSAVPVVDFTKEEVLAIFDGTRPTGGYSISVDSITDKTALRRRISIRHSLPGDACVTTQAVTSPFQIIRVSKSTAVLAREDFEETQECR